MSRVIPKYYDYPMIGRVRNDAKVALANSDPLLIARGMIDGAFVVNKFGANTDSAADTTEDIWDGGGTYPFPSTADITHIAQATNQVATDGGATIEVQGLDADWNLVVQTADLDATDTTTEVALTTPLRRVFRMKCLADVVLAADVSAVASGGGTTYATMLAGNNQTLMAIYTVPAGYEAYMTGYYYSVTDLTNRSPTSTEFRLWAADRGKGYEFQLKHMVGVAKAASGDQHFFVPPTKFSEKTDIKITALAADLPADVHAGFDLILIAV